ncbi:MAG TPA: hypothetical protein VM841_01130 [Actinomycetota bacterium]|nr:hypothetical protein [Actinomycetota bacterium]
MDDAEKVAALMSANGLAPEETWVGRPEHRYDPDELCTLHTRYGRRNQRWLSLGDEARRSTLAAFRASLDERPELLVWRPEVVYALARRP